jgi:hypothetical protein
MSGAVYSEKNWFRQSLQKKIKISVRQESKIHIQTRFRGMRIDVNKNSQVTAYRGLGLESAGRNGVAQVTNTGKGGHLG